MTQPNAGVNVSDPLKATFTFESSTQALPYGNGGTSYTCPPLCEYLDPVTSASITVGGKTWSLGSAPSGNNQSRLFVSDNAYTAEDIFGGGFFLSGSMLGPYRPYYFEFGVTDPTGTHFNGAGLPRTFNLNGTYGGWRVDFNQTPSDYQFLYGQITYLSNAPLLEKVAVVLVHGIKSGASSAFSADGNLYDADTGLVCQKNETPAPALRPECIPQMGMELRKEGFIVAQAFDYSDKTPKPAWTIQELAGELDKHIQCVLKGDCLSPEQKRELDNIKSVDIVSHSMGGLIARAYIAGLAQDKDQNDEKVPYADDIRKLVTIATPHYGAGVASVGSTVIEHGVYIPGFGKSVQVKQMSLGSRFTWDLNETWRANKPSIDMLAIAGTEGLCLVGTYVIACETDNDEVVNIASAALPSSLLDDDHIAYVFHIHQGIAAISDNTDPAYRLIRDFLGGKPLNREYTPSSEVLKNGLLTVRFADQETHEPIVPNGNSPIAIDDDTNGFSAWVNDDGGTVTVRSLEAGTHSITATPPVGYKQPAQLDGVEIESARPTTAVIELEPAPDLVITKFTAGNCRRDGSRRVKVIIKNQGKKISPATTGRVLVSVTDSVPSGDDFMALSFSIGELLPNEKVIINELAAMPELLGVNAVVNLIAMSDFDRTVDESNEDNNSSTLAVENCR